MLLEGISNSGKRVWQISQHFEVGEKKLGALLSDWISDETPFLMFDTFVKLHKDRPIDLYGENNLTS